VCTACFPCGLQSLALHGLIWFIYAMMEKRDRACYSDAVAREQQERVEVRNKEDKVRLHHCICLRGHLSGSLAKV